MLRSNNVAHKYKSTRNDMLENFIAILEVAQLFSNKVYARHDAACGCTISIVIKPFALLSYNNCITRQRRSLRL